MLGLYKEAEFPPETISELRALNEKIKAAHPTLHFSWCIPDPTRQVVRVQILGIESSFLIQDAIAAFRRLAGVQ